MNIDKSRLQGSIDFSRTVERKSPRNRKSYSLTLARTLLIALYAVALTLLLASPTPAQSPSPSPSPSPNPCPTEMTPGQNLFSVPVIGSANGKLQGTVMLSDEQEWMAVRVPVGAPPGKRSQCIPQPMRIFREWGAASRLASAPYGLYSKAPAALPRPGPTLRARVGDLVQLTLINQINVLDFPFSIDRGETGQGGGCDESNAGYPGADKFPDCFHGSSTGNIHFHGTHTNPNTTGDNVFIEVRPSLRDAKGQPVVTPQGVAASFDSFFKKCEVELSHSVLTEWPRTWSDLPAAWTDEQKKLLRQYDADLEKKYGPGVRKLWPIDQAQVNQGAWAQYYIGAYPYCFRLPEYTNTVWPPPPPTAMQMGGTGTAEMGDTGGSALMMGQAPGTHWYHAHKHGSTAIDVANGMTGALIIEGQYDDDLNKWYGTNDVPLWTRTQPVLVINQLGTPPNLMLNGAGQQDKGPDFSINGQLNPAISMKPGEVQMWRIVNTSGRAGVLFLGPPAGFQWKQIAQDGVQFNKTNYDGNLNKSFLLMAGNRADLLVKAPSTGCAKAGDCNFIVKNEVDPTDVPKANPLNLLSVVLTGKAVAPTANNGQFMPTAPTFPPFLADVADSEIKATRTMTFRSDGSQAFVQHLIDNKQFDGEVGAVVLLNQAEEWKVINETYGGRIVSHPFHIHINPFQIVEVFSPNDTLPATSQTAGATIPKYIFDEKARKSPAQCYLDPTKPDTWNPRGANPQKPCSAAPPKTNLIWWDVFPIPSGIKATNAAGKPIIDPATNKQVQVPGYFKMRSRFVDYPGFYVLHCHILAHEDRGMMTIVEVAPVRTPYSHH
mgnify:CR=1 FL=1